MRSILLSVVILFCSFSFSYGQQHYIPPVTLNVPQAMQPYQMHPYRPVVRQRGRYLGNTSPNQYDPNSINNPYGRYGNPYSPDSIHNPYGAGNKFGPNMNPYGPGMDLYENRNGQGVNLYGR